MRTVLYERCINLIVFYKKKTIVPTYRYEKRRLQFVKTKQRIWLLNIELFVQAKLKLFMLLPLLVYWHS